MASLNKHQTSTKNINEHQTRGSGARHYKQNESDALEEPGPSSEAPASENI
jgi:hypothetical protein